MSGQPTKDDAISSAAIEFLKTEHKKTLDALRHEIADLRDKNTGTYIHVPAARVNTHRELEMEKERGGGRLVYVLRPFKTPYALISFMVLTACRSQLQAHTFTR